MKDKEMSILEKVRALPEPKRKLIFWLVVITSAILLLFLWVRATKTRLEQLKMEEIKEKIPPSPFENIEFPKIEIEEGLKELEELLLEEEQKNGQDHENQN